MIRRGSEAADPSTTLRSGRNTKGEGAASIECGCEQDPFFIALGGPLAHDFSGRKTFPGKGPLTPQISPLRSFGAPVEMTKGRAALPLSVVAEQDPFFITLGGPTAHDFPGRDDKGRTVVDRYKGQGNGDRCA